MHQSVLWSEGGKLISNRKKAILWRLKIKTGPHSLHVCKVYTEKLPSGCAIIVKYGKVLRADPYDEEHKKNGHHQHRFDNNDGVTQWLKMHRALSICMFFSFLTILTIYLHGNLHDDNGKQANKEG